jgi:hypothetical protein
METQCAPPDGSVVHGGDAARRDVWRVDGENRLTGSDVNDSVMTAEEFESNSRCCDEPNRLSYPTAAL